MRTLDAVGVLAAGTIWGMSYLFIKVAGAEIPPFTLVAVRIGLAAMLLGALVAARRIRLPRDGRSWRILMFLGVFNQAVPFVLITWGEHVVASGVTSILIATVPLWTVVFARAIGDEVLSVEKAAGVIVGLAGVAVLIGPDVRDLACGVTVGAAAILVASASYGASLNAARRGALRLEPLAIAVGQMIVGFAVAAPLALAERPWTLRPSAVAMGSLVSLSVLGSAVAYVIFFSLLRRLAASQVSVVTYVSPATSVILGTVLLHEAVGGRTLAGVALVALGVALVNGVTRLPALRRPEPEGEP